MKKILFVLPSYRYGGTMTSFKNLLLLINKDYDIHVKAIVNEGDAYDFISQYSQVLDHRVTETTLVATNRPSIKRRFAKGAKDLLSNIGFDIAPLILKRQAKRFDCSSYDAVIAFQEGYATYFVSQTNAKNKIAWIHSIYSRLVTIEKKAALKAYDNVDKIVCVSQTAKGDLIDTRNNCQDSVHVVYNALDSGRVLAMAKENVDLADYDGVSIISVGRIDPVKRFSRIPSIVAALKSKGLKVRWTIVGGIAVQSEYDLLQSEILKYKVTDDVILKGQCANPYPYIKHSDLLVCLSSSETFNYTLAEARTLGVPVVTTDFPAASEFVEHGVNGCIATIDNVVNEIYSLFAGEGKYQKAKKDVAEFEYDNRLIKLQLAGLLN